MNSIDHISGNLRNKRLQYGLSQSMLAEKCGVSTDTIAKIESGRRYPSIDLLITFAEVLHTDIDSLLTEPKSLPVDLFSKKIAHVLDQTDNSAELINFVAEFCSLLVKHFGTHNKNL